jgi:hypothetical protein
MVEIWEILTSWPFLMMGGIVFIIVAFFNGLGKWRGIGSYLWATKNKFVRRVLKVMEAWKMPFMFLIGFGLGWIPQIPRPPQLEEQSQLSIALLYGIAGLCSTFIVKHFKKYAEGRGIDIDLDLDPKQQKRAKNL